MFGDGCLHAFLSSDLWFEGRAIERPFHEYEFFVRTGSEFSKIRLLAPECWRWLSENGRQIHHKVLNLRLVKHAPLTYDDFSDCGMLIGR